MGKKNIYSDKYYKLTSMIPISEISQKDRRCIQEAVSISKDSEFHSSQRVGCVILYKGSFVQGRKSTQGEIR